MTTPIAFKGQKYSLLKKNASDKNVLFIDPEFPPESKSLWKTPKEDEDIEWKRPKDLCKDPHLVVDEKAICHDVRQGQLGNCWLVAACSCLAVNRSLWDQVVPNLKAQDWESTEPNSSYAGIFYFRFWKYGQFTEVVVDDLLPTKQGELVFMHNGKKDEFWCALLEKAYAKLSGSYEALSGGELCEGLEDLTGGVTEEYNFKEEKFQDNAYRGENFFTKLHNDLSNMSLMAVAIPAVKKEDTEKATAAGLIIGHAYSITLLKKINSPKTKGNLIKLPAFMGGDKLAMVRLRNPWGEADWKGAFSEKSDEWALYSEKERLSEGLVFDEPGEFWMKLDDFLASFVHLSVCRVMNVSFFSLAQQWHASSFSGTWRVPDRCGGSVNNLESFLDNPQYCLIANEGDEMMLVLTQMTEEISERKVIGFTILKVEENRQYRLHKPLQIVTSSPFKNSRSVFLRQEKIPKGRYLLVATMYDKDVEGKYLLRIYQTSNNPPLRLDLDLPSSKALSCLPGRGYPQVATRVTIVSGSILKRAATASGINPYVIIRCEGEKWQSKVVKATADPVFDFSCIFYRVKPNNPIVVDVMHSGIFTDEFVGRIALLEPGPVSEKSSEYILGGKKDPSIPTDCGILNIHTSTHFNLRSF